MNKQPPEPASSDVNRGSWTAPPQAPEMPRQWKFYRFQYVALPILLLIPILALMGVFGETAATIEAVSAGFIVRVQYPDRAHYEANNQIVVTLRNETGRDLSNVSVEFDRKLLDQCSELSFNPALKEITESVYRVEVGGLRAGGERVVTLDYQPDMNGHHDSWVRAGADGISPVQAAFSMFVFP